MKWQNTDCLKNRMDRILVFFHLFLKIWTLLKAGSCPNWNVKFIGAFPVLNHFCEIDACRAILLLSFEFVAVNYKSLIYFNRSRNIIFTRSIIIWDPKTQIYLYWGNFQNINEKKCVIYLKKKKRKEKGKLNFIKVNQSLYRIKIMMIQTLTSRLP